MVLPNRLVREDKPCFAEIEKRAEAAGSFSALSHISQKRGRTCRVPSSEHQSRLHRFMHLIEVGYGTFSGRIYAKAYP